MKRNLLNPAGGARTLAAASWFAARVNWLGLGERFASGVAWSVVAAAASRGFTLIGSIIIARLVGTAGFGEYTAIQSTIGPVLVMAGFGLGMTATKYVAELHQSDAAAATRMATLCGTIGLVTGGIFAGTLAIFSGTIAERLLGAPQLVQPLITSAIVVLFSTLVTMQNGVLAGFEAFDTIAHVGLLSGPLGLLSAVAGTYVAGVEGAVAGLAVTQIVTWLLNRRALAKRSAALVAPRFVWPTVAERRALMAYSAPTVLCSLLIAVTNWVGIAVLVNRADGYRQLGVFGAANQWMVALLVLPTIVGQVIFPHATRIVKDSYAASSRMLRQATGVSALVSLPIVVVGCALSPFVMRAYGSGFRDSSVTLIVVLATAGVMAIQTPAVHVVAAAGRMWWLLKTYLIWGAVFAGGAVLAVRWGALGLASIRLIAYVLHSLMILVVARRTLMEAAIPGATTADTDGVGGGRWTSRPFRGNPERRDHATSVSRYPRSPIVVATNRGGSRLHRALRALDACTM